MKMHNRLREKRRATCGTLAVLVLLSLAGVAHAGVAIRGVEPDATVTGDLKLHASSSGRADMTVIQLLGPDGVKQINRSFSNNVSLTGDGQPWAAASQPPGLYTVSAFAVTRGRITDTERPELQRRRARIGPRGSGGDRHRRADPRLPPRPVRHRQRARRPLRPRHGRHP